MMIGGDVDDDDVAHTTPHVWHRVRGGQLAMALRDKTCPQ
eukprot:CAMPEP_0203914118 /NCGR_PEP_ID=MMETSP0359-20131031/55053_1 /ASSEMBLY_ACC=CAM_ASM_000338 /TAXON_ID=268821 /ORGANISM="Scrippsiella Hangoei, Strain SHTV-5" /LENGTH=39 /DNA_ID= /DNA_START= /DNA_END= /DNA_ORIENTATION=